MYIPVLPLVVLMLYMRGNDGDTSASAWYVSLSFYLHISIVEAYFFGYVNNEYTNETFEYIDYSTSVIGSKYVTIWIKP